MTFREFSTCAALLASMSACSVGSLRRPQTAADAAQARMDENFSRIADASTSGLKKFRSFSLVAECDIACRGGKSARIAGISQVFEPDATPYAEANGNLVPMLTSRLQVLSDRSCLARAESNCGSREAIARVRAVSVRSGAWKASLPFDCEQARGCVLSPYDSNVGALDFVDTPDVSDRFPEKQLSFSDRNEAVAERGCRHLIRAHACFGDCVVSGDQCGDTKGSFLYSVVTTDPGARQTIEICGDELADRLAKMRLAQSVRAIACREYFYAYLMGKTFEGYTCAAYRATIPSCDSF